MPLTTVDDLSRGSGIGWSEESAQASTFRSCMLDEILARIRLFTGVPSYPSKSAMEAVARYLRFLDVGQVRRFTIS
jgi:hypothetical protein